MSLCHHFATCMRSHSGWGKAGHGVRSGLEDVGEILYGFLVPDADGNRDRMMAGALLTAMM